MNSANLVGRLGSDPEEKRGDDWVNCRFSIAVRRRPRKGETKDDARRKPYWFDITAWGRAAETIMQYSKKGDQIALICEIEPRVWTDTDGVKHKVTDYKVEWFEFLGSGRKYEAEEKPNGNDSRYQSKGSGFSKPFDDDDIRY